MRHVGSLENHGLRRQACLNSARELFASVTSERVRSLLIRQKDDQIRLPRKFGWLRNHELTVNAVNQPWVVCNRAGRKIFGVATIRNFDVL